METPEPPDSNWVRVILIVDDEEDVGNLVSDILTQAGFKTLLAGQGHEALELIQRRTGKIDLVVTDVMMPGLDGPTLARRIRHDWPAIPVLFMTSYPGDTLADQGLLARDIPRIEKPFNTRSLIRQVRSILHLPPSTPGTPG